MRQNTVDDLWGHVDKTDTCWLWTASLHKTGYAYIRIATVKRLAHVVSWEIVHGSKPKGMDIDHLCRVRHCVNPDHLELVTKRENTIRGNVSRNKTSGLPLGVFHNHKRFGAQKRFDGVYTYLGTFDTPEQAHNAYMEAIQ